MVGDLAMSSVNAGNLMGNACIDTTSLWHCMHGAALDHADKKAFQVAAKQYTFFHLLLTFLQISNIRQLVKVLTS